MVPKSLGMVNDSTDGWEWCGSPHPTDSRAAVSESGDTVKSGPVSPCITAPPENIEVAPASLTMMWAVS